MITGRHHNLLYLLAVSMLVVATFSRLARGELLRRPYTMQRNFPHGRITAIENGTRYVWFGGWAYRPGEEDGVARYDKRTDSWRMFLESEGLMAEEITSVAVDGDRVWIGSATDHIWNRGLYRYDPARMEATRFQVEDGLPYWRVRDILVLKNEVWAATMGGVGRFSKADETWQAYTQEQGDIASDFTTCIAADDETVWVGSFAGVERYDRRSGTWQSVGGPNSPFPGAVTAIGIDQDDVWFLSPPRVIRYNRSSQQFIPFQIAHAPALQEPLKTMAVTEDEVFFGSAAGLHVYSSTGRTWKTFTEADGMVNRDVDVLAADDDRVWCVDTLGRGISCYNRRTGRWRRHFYREGCPENYIYSLLLHEDELFVGTLGSGFWKYHTRRDEWVNLNMTLKEKGTVGNYLGTSKGPLMHNAIRKIVWHDNRVWLATNRGLCVHEPPGAVDFTVITPEPFPMQSLAAFGRTLLCGGTRDGLRIYTPETGEWSEPVGPQLRKGPIPAMAAGEKEAFVASSHVIYRFAAPDEPPVRLNAAVQGEIRALLLKDRKLWIGTNEGLWIYDLQRDTTRRIHTRLLPNPVVHTLAWTRGRFWVGTEQGLATCDEPDGEWRMFRAPDVLTAPIVSAVAGDERHLWVATLGGGMVRLSGTDTQGASSW